jgi:malate dehydrogenase
MSGKTGVVECAFVKSDVTEASYFATPIRLGKGGMEENLGLPKLSPFEQKKLEEVTLYRVCLE